MIARKTKITSAIALAIGIAAVPAPAQSNPAAYPGQSAKPEQQQDSTGIAATIRQYSLAQRDQAARATQQAMEDIDRRMKSVEQALDRKFEGMSRSAREESRETLARLHRQRNELSEWYGGIKHSSAAAWEEVKQGFATSYDALAQALSKARKKF